MTSSHEDARGSGRLVVEVYVPFELGHLNYGFGESKRLVLNERETQEVVVDQLPVGVVVRGAVAAVAEEHGVHER